MARIATRGSKARQDAPAPPSKFKDKLSHKERMNLELDSFIDRFGGMTEEYTFYQGQVTLRYDPKGHVYLLVTPNGLEVQEGSSSVGKIIDKSNALVPWGCRMMQNKLLATTPTIDGYVSLPRHEFERLVLEAKTAHKERLDEAGKVGNIAHAYIETYIKAVLAQDQPLVEQILANMPIDERAASCSIAALTFMQAHNIRWLSTERKVYSRKYKFAGTLDGLAKVDSCSDPLCCPVKFKDRLAVLDWKSSNSLHLEHILQTASYEQAYEEETGEIVTDRFIVRLGKEEGDFEVWHRLDEDFKPDFDAFLDALRLTRSVKALEERIKYVRDARTLREKEARALARQEALKIACKGSGTYQGKRKPKCNGGTPCESCLAKYAEVQAAKPVKPKKKRGNSELHTV
jgi:hypothetical protein